MTVNMKKVGSVPHHDLMIAEADDILIVVPEAGYKDTAEVSHQVINAMREYAQKLGRKCGLIINYNNILAQDTESRHAYAERVTPDLFFGVTLVVSNPLARALGNIGVRLTPVKVPLSLCESVEAGITLLESLRK